MGDARSKLDILYQDVLGEIHDVISQVETLRKDVDAASGNAAARIEVQAGVMVAAAERLQRQVDLVASAAVMKSVEAGKADLRKAAADAASEAMREAVSAEVTRIGQAVNSIAAAAGHLRSNRLQGAVLAAVAGIFGALAGVAVLVASGLLSPPPTQLSEADAQAINTGRMLTKVWPALSQRERDRITELSKTNTH